MERLEWDDIYSVNVAEIDEQHKSIFRMINDLYDYLEEGCNQKNSMIIHNVLLRLMEYALIHFETEENYFKKFNYADRVAHQREHADFSKKVMAFNQEFDEGKAALKYDMLTFLIEWLSTHILECDKAYSECFNEHGLK